MSTEETLTDVYVHWRRIQRVGNPDAYVHRMLVNNARSRWRARATRRRLPHGPCRSTIATRLRSM